MDLHIEKYALKSIKVNDKRAQILCENVIRITDNGILTPLNNKLFI